MIKDSVFARDSIRSYMLYSAYM